MKPVIEQLKEISENHQYKSIRFTDKRTMKVDAWTANAMLCVYNAINAVNKAKFEEKIQTKLGFMSMAQFSFENTKIRG